MIFRMGWRRNRDESWVEMNNVLGSLTLRFYLKHNFFSFLLLPFHVSGLFNIHEIHKNDFFSFFSSHAHSSELWLCCRKEEKKGMWMMFTCLWCLMLMLVFASYMEYIVPVLFSSHIRQTFNFQCCFLSLSSLQREHCDLKNNRKSLS